ncbi:hypothetical protein TcG_09758 [Trypanosoma cruzi]|nr:hypothetical protein TcG_09758 [Trypanosoma cruzi]
MPRDRERGKSGVFPPTIDPSIPSSWSETKGNKRACLHLLAGGRAEVGFLLLICSVTVSVLTLLLLFFPGAFIVRFVRLWCPTFSAPPNGVLRRIGIHGCGRALCRSPVITHTRTVSARLIRHVLQNGRNCLWDITSFAASGQRGKMERYAENVMLLHNTAGWRRQGSGSF